MAPNERAYLDRTPGTSAYRQETADSAPTWRSRRSGRRAPLTSAPGWCGPRRVGRETEIGNLTSGSRDQHERELGLQPVRGGEFRVMALGADEDAERLPLGPPRVIRGHLLAAANCSTRQPPVPGLPRAGPAPGPGGHWSCWSRPRARRASACLMPRSGGGGPQALSPLRRRAAAGRSLSAGRQRISAG